MKYFAFLLLLAFFFCAYSGSKNAQSTSGEIQGKQNYTTDPTLPSKDKKSTVRTALPANESLIHVVQKGESLWIIV